MNNRLEPVRFLIEDEADQSELGYVYVLRGVGAGKPFYKIGRSRDIDTRMQQLCNTSLPFQFELVYWHPISEGEPDVELRLHAYFESFRTRGEWFVIPEEKSLCEVLEGFLGMCPFELQKGYRLEAQQEIMGLA